MTKYNVTGMSCAACSARVEKAVSQVAGVDSCTVNLLMNSMIVEGDVSPQEIMDAVKKAGYGASLQKSGREQSKAVHEAGDGGQMQSTCTTVTCAGDDAADVTDSQNAWEDEIDAETKKIKNRLLTSLALLLVLMYFSMGHMMWNFPVPAFFIDNPVGQGLLQLFLTTAVMLINRKFFISGYRGVIHKAPNMDTLVSLGALAAYVYSVVSLFAMTSAQASGNFTHANHLMHELYFESAAMILTLVTIGKMLESRAKGKTTNALKGLLQLAPKKAVVLRDGKEVVLPVEAVKVGDLFIVRPGESVAVDGEVVKGSSTVNESALTGESIPVDKTIGDEVSAATINQYGVLECRATRIGADTTFSKIIELVGNASATKAPIARIADKVSGVFVPVVISIAALTFVVWLLSGQAVGFALARAISVLVISCPCALGLATPVAIMVGNGVGAKNGILFKTAEALEQTGKADIVVLDKTGTITQGHPQVTDILPFLEHKKDELLKIAYALEQNSEHPIAEAVCREAEHKKITAKKTENFKVLPGNGISAVIDGTQFFAGALSYIKTVVDISKETEETAAALSKQGKTLVLIADKKTVYGMLAVSDALKEDSKQAVSLLKKMGLRVVMLSGDNKFAANEIGKQVGIEEVYANVLPDGKEKVVRELKKEGNVIMVGDGINDAPALASADIGAAIGAGTEIAMDAADVILMRDSLCDMAAAIQLSKATYRNIKENLFWAFFYNAIGIPVAAGVFISAFGWQLNPMFAAAAMSLSSFCVVSNALRLNAVKIYKKEVEYKKEDDRQKICRDAEEKNKKLKGEEKKMEKQVKVEGMMCGHCEAHVKEALEALPQVESATANHETGIVVMQLQEDVSDDVIRETIKAQGYQVVE